MSRGQTPRTPRYFPRMKHRAFGRLIASHGGGYLCGQHGISWHWRNVDRDTYEAILADIEDHEELHWGLDYPDVDDSE